MIHKCYSTSTAPSDAQHHLPPAFVMLGLKLRSLVVVGLAFKEHAAGLQGRFAVGRAETKAGRAQMGRIEVFDKPQT